MAQRWAVRTALALVAVATLLVGGVLAVGRNLEQPWIKRRLQALVQDATGFELDYRSARLSANALAVDSLLIRAPQPLAPDLLRASRVRARFAWSSPWVRELTLDQVALTVALDEHGNTSFDSPSSAPSSDAEPTPLSRKASDLLGGRLPVEQVRVSGLTLTLVQHERGVVVERDTLRGLSLRADATPAAHGTRLHVELGTPAFALTRQRPSQRDDGASGKIAVVLTASASEATLAVGVQLAHQDIAPRLAVVSLAQIEAHARFLAEQTEIQVSQLEVGDGAATAKATLRIPDQGAPHIVHASGELDALHLLELASAWAPPVALRAGHLHYQLDDFTLDRPATSARVNVEGELAGLELRDQGLAIDDTRLSVHAQPSAAGLQVEGNASLSSLRYTQQESELSTGKTTLTFAGLQNAQGVLSGRASLRSFIEELRSQDSTLSELPLQVQLKFAELTPEAMVERTQGKLSLTVDSEPLHATLDAARFADALDHELLVETPSIDPSWLSEELAERAPWAQTAVSLHSKGRIEQLLAEPIIKQKSELRLSGGGFDDVSAQELALQLQSSGTRIRHQLHADLRVQALQLEGKPRANDHLTLAMTVDRARPALQLSLHNDRQPATHLDGSLSFERGKKALNYKLSGRLAQLTPLVGLLSRYRALAGFDLTDLNLELEAKGRVTGLIARADANGMQLAPDPIRTVAGQGTLAVRATDFRWADGDAAVEVPALRFTAEMHGEGNRRAIESQLNTEHVEAAYGEYHVAAAGIDDHTSVVMTDGTIEHSQQITMRALDQRVLPSYVVGDVTANLVARRDPEGLIKISELRFDNRAGGSSLLVQGGVQLSADEQRMSLHALFDQDLGRLSKQREQFTGAGRLALDMGISSADFHMFHTASKLTLDGATVSLPAAKIALETMNGELPVVTDFVVDKDGVEVLRGARINPYTAQRFPDQHPLLGYRSFLSIARVSTPYVSVAPFAANLELARNIVSLSQVELGVRGGTITGSGMFEYNGRDSKLDANLRASGVKSSHGEPFDGNAAISIGLGERSIEGRADILRIGRRHLTDLLDLQDPLHADGSINQIRRALRFGYPDRVRISFQHGFASAGVEFGGLARLLKLNDVRGIPIGPVMERMMSSVQPPLEAEHTP